VVSAGFHSAGTNAANTSRMPSSQQFIKLCSCYSTCQCCQSNSLLLLLPPGSRACFQTAVEYLEGFQAPVALILGNHGVQQLSFWAILLSALVAERCVRGCLLAQAWAGMCLWHSSSCQSNAPPATRCIIPAASSAPLFSTHFTNQAWCTGSSCLFLNLYEPAATSTILVLLAASNPVADSAAIAQWLSLASLLSTWHRL
jgi:hypothetical protein